MMNRSLLGALLCLLVLPHAFAEDTPIFRDKSKPVEARVNDILSQLTDAEKIDLLGGIDSMHTRPVPRLGIPGLNMSDGPVGVHNYGMTTVYPAGICLAATWDAELAKREGIALGLDARARDVHIHLAPGVNIYRTPQNGRNFEYFGEDPFLASQIAKNYIIGEQSQGVVSTIKHFACNNQEFERGTISAEVDERTLNEIYFPVFRVAVQEAHVRAVMSSYNKIHGVWSSHNDWLLNQMLKKSWGFDGIVMSDWGAVHDAFDTITGGCDLEMPGPEHLKPEVVTQLLKEGKITQSQIDDKVRRYFRVMIEMGFLDHPQINIDIPRDDPRSAVTSLEVARSGIVLLKNEGNLLPLDRAKAKRIVVTGFNAHPPVFAGGGSAFSDPFKAKSVLEGLTFAATSPQQVQFLPTFNPDSIAALADASQFLNDSLHVEYFDNQNLEGVPLYTQNVRRINFSADRTPPEHDVPKNKFSARWKGKIQPQRSAEYRFIVRSDDGSRVIVDGKTIIDFWSDHQMETREVAMKLTANQSYDIEIEYYDSGGAAEIQFAWCDAKRELTLDEINAIKSADAVVACVGFNQNSEGEGADRSYDLPGKQADYIRQLTELNKHVIVVLNSGGGVEMESWINRVPALLQAWYPGQEGGTAIAEILFGEVNPSGKLPISIERKLEDNPSFGNYPGKDGKVEYAEGIFVGYRWYDAKKIEPRFPFGFGLSYTQFKIENLKVERSGEDINIDASITNTGSRAGADVLQVYVRTPGKAVPRPPQELKALAKVSLQARETRRVRFQIHQHDLRYWDVETHGWKFEPGQYEFAAGDSSRNLPATAKLTLP